MCVHVLKNCIHHLVTDIMFLSRELKGHVDTDNVSTFKDILLDRNNKDQIHKKERKDKPA